MKIFTRLLGLFVIIVSIASCGGAQKNQITNEGVASDTVRIANDSLEYEIIIIEPGFNQWLLSQMPRGFNEQYWLENRNQIFVTNYNNRALNLTQYDNALYLQPIDYRFDVDYGYEVNYLLYNWFIFFQERYKQDLR